MSMSLWNPSMTNTGFGRPLPLSMVHRGLGGALDTPLGAGFGDELGFGGLGGLRLPSPFDLSFPSDLAGEMQQLIPRCESWATKNKFHISLEMPNVPKENLKVLFNKNTNELTIEGQHETVEDSEDFNWVRREMHRGKYVRKFVLPADTDPSKITATITHGIVNLTMPKPQNMIADKSEKLNIDIVEKPTQLRVEEGKK